VTFNEKQAATCHQKLKRDQAAADPAIRARFPEPSPELLVLKRAVVKRITRNLAWKIISTYEWLGTLPMCNHYFGIFFGPYCAGVACYAIGGGGAGVNVPMWLGYTNKESAKIAYLARGACVHWAPKGSAPKLINWSGKLLSRELGCEVALAYSDTDAGEIGTVYQASGWTCLGRGSSTQQYVSQQGRVYDQKLASNMGKAADRPRSEAHQALLKAGYRVQASNPKWRYGLILESGRGNKKLVQRFEELKAPYPKREQQSDNA